MNTSTTFVLLSFSGYTKYAKLKMEAMFSTTLTQNEYFTRLMGFTMHEKQTDVPPMQEVEFNNLKGY